MLRDDKRMSKTYSRARAMLSSVAHYYQSAAYVITQACSNVRPESLEMR